MIPVYSMLGHFVWISNPTRPNDRPCERWKIRQAALDSSIHQLDRTYAVWKEQRKLRTIVMTEIHQIIVERIQIQTCTKVKMPRIWQYFVSDGAFVITLFLVVYSVTELPFTWYHSHLCKIEKLEKWLKTLKLMRVLT